MLIDTSPSRPPAQGTEGDATRWLTVRDVQAQLRIGQQLTYRLLRDGTIPSIKIGGVYRIRQEVLDELKEQARIGA